MRFLAFVTDLIILTCLMIIGFAGYVTLINPPSTAEQAWCSLISDGGGFDYATCILDKTT